MEEGQGTAVEQRTSYRQILRRAPYRRLAGRDRKGGRPRVAATDMDCVVDPYEQSMIRRQGTPREGELHTGLEQN